eukprot:CAMPEP_0172666638 /NCGR_PEP_ID=MMETSP1074-20121228/7927_1 /TAXON_ID=2916 /ORGANISM="Ceratium fusus, Strain PA161109" /LENGTH=325 /DNA_ID=CAMNT_0013483045 /DNA_START=45 /DNA_END=1022 /DNA_ORIENTATION=+
MMQCVTLCVVFSGAAKFLWILPEGYSSSTFSVAHNVLAARQLTGTLQSGLRPRRCATKQQGKSVACHADNTETTSAPSLNVDLTGKVALVTGASRGIGAAIAEKLAAAGATVIGTATTDSGAEAISARFTGDLKGKGMKLNVVNADEIKGVLKDIEAEFGTPDILINNAGITKDGLMLRMKEADWSAVIDANLNSIYRMTQGVLKGMTKKRWGRVISISSVVGSMGNGGQANYAASKAGQEGFTRALAREVASRSITVNAVAPGFIQSDMTAVLKDEWKAKLLESVPAGRLGTPEEIAEAVLFLSAPSSAYITGQVLHVNGGMYM